MRAIDLKMQELNKKFKADIIQQGTDIIEVDKIPFSSPMANYMTYGGVPVGKITEFFFQQVHHHMSYSLPLDY